MKKLVVIPSDRISEYEAKGTSSWLKDYYNPTGFFDEVYVLSPIEKEYDQKFGLKIIPVNSTKDYKNKLREINPICVRAYGGYWATDYAVFNKIKGIPVVSSVHDKNDALIYNSLKFSDYIISMSSVIKNILLKRKLGTNNNIEILGNRVDSQIFKPIKNSEDSIKEIRKGFPNGKMILHVGRKTHEKNIENVIKSLNFLSEDYFLVQIGKGDFSKYKDLIDNENLNKRVFEIQTIENHELPLWYNAADVVCVPSRSEGFGIVFIEAAACMSKIVTSDIAPMNEFLENDLEMNFLVKNYESPKKISEAIFLACKKNITNKTTLESIIKKYDKTIVDKKEADIYLKMSNLKMSFSLKYFIWKIKNDFNTYLIPQLVKLPKRVWKKILSYL